MIPRPSLASGEQILLRVYLRATDQYHLRPVYEQVVDHAHRHGLAGATVLRGIYGFGRTGVFRGSDLHLAHDVPVIVEMIDEPGRIAELVEGDLGTLVREGIVTLERAGVLAHRGPGALELPGEVVPLSTLPTLELKGAVQAMEDAVLLRVLIGEADREPAPGGRKLYEAIVHKARELGLRGATVLRGAMGFGANSIVHRSKIEALSNDLPIVIELVDTPGKIDSLLPYLQTVVAEGLITTEQVRVVLYRHNPAGGSS